MGLRPARPRRHAVRAEVRVSVMSLIPTASQTVGPYLHLGLTPITIADIARDATKGETIVISGRVLDGEGKPIPDALLKFWQANADGKYAHQEDTQDKPLDGQ